MVPTKGYAAHVAHEPLKPFSFDRRDPQPRDVLIEVLFCGGLSFRSTYRAQ